MSYYKIVFFICFYFAFFPKIKAQANIDSLQLELNIKTDKKEKLIILNNLTKQMIRENHKDLISYLKDYIVLAKNLKEYDLMASKSRFLVQQYIMKGENEKAFGLIDSMFFYKTHFKKKNSKAHLLLKRGGVYFSILNYKKAIVDLDTAADLFMESKDSIYAADGYLFSGQANSIEGNFVSAINQLEKAHNLYEILNDKDYTFFVGQELNSIYLKNGLKEEAKRKSKKIFDFITENKMTNALAAYYLFELITNLKENDLILAKNSLDSLNKFNSEVTDVTLKRNNTYNTEALSVLFYLKKKNLNLAKFHFNKVLEFEKEGIVIHAKLQIAEIKAEYYKETGEYIKALKLLKKNQESILKKDIYNYTSKDSEKLLASIYSQLGNYKASNFHLNNYVKIKDSLKRISTANAYAFQQTKFEATQKEKQILNQKLEIEKLEVDKILAANKRNTLIILLFLILLLGIGIWWKEKLKREKLNSEIRINKEELTNFTNQLLLKSKEQENLRYQFEKLKEIVNEKESVNSIQELMESKILTKDDWYNFKEKFIKVHPSFFNEIKGKGYSLTKSEERLVALEKLGLDNNEISKILGVSIDSVFVSRYRLRKKIKAPKEVSILEFLS